MKKKRTFVLVYGSPADPTPSEVDRTLETLEGFEAEEVVPGTIQIIGEPAKVQKVAAKIDGWTLATEGQLSDHRPHRSIK
ncbi:hypothetical protein [Mesorhizobium sp. M0910]|uniref:hypothetical protein n=1 Tax=Mesorhizobium sp. M0910 TaxID=2957025 RepID=UPI003335AB9B